jgi:hypothetical protein
VERSNGVVQWNIVFSRLVHDWKVETLASFYSCLYAYKLRGVGEDKLWWIPSSKGVFEVSSFYRVLSPHGTTPFPWKGIWRTKVLMNTRNTTKRLRSLPKSFPSPQNTYCLED